MAVDKQSLLTTVGQALYGERWQTYLARDLDLADGRRVRQWLSGDRPIPDGIWIELEKLIIRKKETMDDVLVKLSCHLTKKTVV